MRCILYDLSTGKIIQNVESNSDVYQDGGIIDLDGAAVGIKEISESVPFTSYVNLETGEICTRENPATFDDVLTAAETNDSDIDAVIQNYLTTECLTTTVAAWKIENYKILRQKAYPDMAEYLDAQAKLSSTDPDIQAAGQAQLDQYNSDCIAVKDRFPKS